MKKKFILVFFAILILTASLSGVVLAETDLSGAWDNDYDEFSLVFDEEGGAALLSESDSIDLIYEWDGETLTITDADGEAFLAGVMDTEGNLVFEELEGYFYRVDEAYYVPETDGMEWDGYSLPGTEWELDGSVFGFSWNGNILMDGEYAGAYYWDGGQTAEMYVEEAIVPLIIDESGIHFEDEDGGTQSFTYLGGITLMSGAYDNDGEEISIVFYPDETFTISNTYDSVDGEYELGGDGSLYLETADNVWYGHYDTSDDTFELDDMEDYFYRMNEPEYVPEPEATADPEEVSDVEGIAGTSWDFPDTESSITFYGDGTGAQTSPWDSIEFEYTWDGETVEISTDWISINGSLDADGNLVLGDDVLTRVETATYVPGMYSGGMESELEGEWIREDGYILLSFDGKDSVSYQVTNDEDNLFGAGTYSYDGTTLTVSLMGDDDEAEEHEGYLDEEGSIVIVLWGEKGRFARGDRSQLVYPVEEITGPAADLVGEWRNDGTGDAITFNIDGSVGYSIDGTMGLASPFEHDGEEVSFSDYTGRLDEAGNMILDGVDHWFTRVEADTDSNDAA